MSLNGTVVLLHGWPVTEYHWRHLLPELRREELTAVPITLPGLGVAATPGMSFRKSHLAAWLHDELEARAIHRPVLVGHDWGASVAALFAAAHPEATAALIVEEEILPGIEVEIPSPGSDHYPSWHGPFNRVVGLAETLVPGRERAYYGTFLRASAGPAGLDERAIREYIGAYADCLEPGLGYYRTKAQDVADVRSMTTLALPVLAIGGRFAMGSSVAEGMRAIATDVTELVLDESGHYPLEQQPMPAARAIVEFLREPAATSGNW